MKEMTRPSSNPWERMLAETARRIDVETKFNIFWITDIKKRYGLLIKFRFNISGIDIENTMKGISVVKVDQDNLGKLYFILNESKDWEIFLSICTDIINVILPSENETAILPIINSRIKRWQRLLSQGNSISMSEISQMGLITELHFLLHSLIPVFKHETAIASWVGSDGDKKDFSLEGFFVEVKSFISSKGRTIKISSLQQLNDDIKPIYLIVYGLTRSTNGISIIDLIGQINELIPEEDYETRGQFESKLEAYGYIATITEPPFYSYIFDSSNSYLVSSDFPRILSQQVDSRIESVQYSIDLSRCTAYEKLLPF